MESEELRLLKENNALLRQIIKYLIEKDSAANDFKNFMIDIAANTIANNRY